MGLHRATTILLACYDQPSVAGVDMNIYFIITIIELIHITGTVTGATSSVVVISIVGGCDVYRCWYAVGITS